MRTWTRLDRRAFFVSTAAAATVAAMRAARATGGLDVNSTPAPSHLVRVLLASGVFAPPQRLDSWHFAWNGRTYRGTTVAVTLTDGRPGLVNVVPLDAYLYGVLSREVGASWSFAAQQAQAIVSRTYALHRLRPNAAYDIRAGDADQNYGGIESETLPGRAAVDETAGAIILYDGKPAHVAYSACCGGMTADAGVVWDTPYPYLRSFPDPNCLSSPNFTWEAELPAQAVERALAGKFDDVGRLRAIDLQKAGAGVRPYAIAFSGTRATVAAPVERFRAAIGPAIVRSTFIRSAALSADGTTASLSGTGNGHGVGLCQWGARSLGKAGASAVQIVAFYFPGTSLGRS